MKKLKAPRIRPGEGALKLLYMVFGGYLICLRSPCDPSRLGPGLRGYFYGLPVRQALRHNGRWLLFLAQSGTNYSAMTSLVMNMLSVATHS